jgi:hypothetical protein
MYCTAVAFSQYDTARAQRTVGRLCTASMMRRYATSTSQLA